jgi:2-polyprenyl-3-methyl-5-hydroxy-6-metoxy-1,4-benzoquinol methylase
LSSDLEATRVTAAAASLGVSGDPIYRAILSRAAALQPQGRALDFGAGTGRLADDLVRRGSYSEVHAVDLVDYGAKKEAGVSWIFADLNERLPVPDSTYDLIVAAEVIEHLENPRFLAREWYRMLRPGGLLVASTPNNESWRSLLSLLARGHFTAFTGASYPAHITALLRADLARALSEAGFSHVDFAYTDAGAIPGFTSRSWQDISMGALRGRRFSDNVVCMARKES